MLTVMLLCGNIIRGNMYTKAHEETRQKIAADVAEFLANGGESTQVPPSTRSKPDYEDMFDVVEEPEYL